MDWKREIVINHLVKQKIAEVDIGRLWQNTLPQVAAREESLCALESALGFNLDSCHRAFLRHADGWRAFFQNVDILSCSELLDGPRKQRAAMLLAGIKDLQAICGADTTQLVPVAVSTDDVDVFAIAKADAEVSGRVFWLAGELIDQFANFEEWFLAMVDYNRRDYQRLVADAAGK